MCLNVAQSLVVCLVVLYHTLWHHVLQSHLDNITTLLSAAAKNLPLLKYSFDQILMTKEGCMNHLRTFYPEARDEDWQLYTFGQMNI